jgi:protein associated with RNAse G/E
MQRGDTIEIRAQKSDGSVYRCWKAQVESAGPECIVTVNRAGDPVGGPCGGWCMKHASRNYYWFERPYNLAEVYQPDGRLKQIYVHIASPARLEKGCLSYVDLELDVVKRPGQPLRIVDEDEFDEACGQYGYSHEFQCSCRAAVDEALNVIRCWQVTGPPRQPSRRLRPRRHRSRRNRQEARTDTPARDSSRASTEV